MTRFSTTLMLSLLLPPAALAQGAGPPDAPPPPDADGGRSFIQITGGSGARLPLALTDCRIGRTT
jgi:hypothetical protein